MIKLALCPNGLKPTELDRRIAGTDRYVYSLKCECQCLRVAESYFCSGQTKELVKQRVKNAWNEEIASKGAAV